MACWSGAWETPANVHAAMVFVATLRLERLMPMAGRRRRETMHGTKWNTYSYYWLGVRER